MSRRVVITGIGLLSSVGIGTDETWKAILAGKNGISPWVYVAHDTKNLNLKFLRLAAKVAGLTNSFHSWAQILNAKKLILGPDIARQRQ